MQPTTTTPIAKPVEPVTTGLPGYCSNSLPAGECMSRGAEKYSCNGLYKTVFEYDGNLVTYTTTEPVKVLWSSNTSNAHADLVCLQTDGQLVIINPDGEIIWGTEWKDEETPSKINPEMVINDDGSLTVDTDEGTEWSDGEPDGPEPGSTTSPNDPTVTPDPFIIPHTDPPYRPKNISDLAGPCGTFLPYNPRTARYDVDNFGFPGGVHWVDSSIQYVGYGNNSWCGKMDTSPGYILSGKGIYMPCQRSRNSTFDFITPNFLAYHPGLK